MLWAYFTFSQFLIIWSGNLPGGDPLVPRPHARRLAVDRARHRRSSTSPCRSSCCSRSPQAPRPRASRSSRSSSSCMRFIDVFWLVTPAFTPGALQVHWLDIAARARDRRHVALALRPAARGPPAAAAARPRLPGAADEHDRRRPGRRATSGATSAPARSSSGGAGVIGLVLFTVAAMWVVLLCSSRRARQRHSEPAEPARQLRPAGAAGAAPADRPARRDRPAARRRSARRSTATAGSIATPARCASRSTAPCSLLAQRRGGAAR